MDSDEKTYPPLPLHWQPPIVPHPIWGRLPLILHHSLALVSVHSLSLNEHWKGKCDEEVYQTQMTRIVGQINNGNIMCGLILSATASFLTTTSPIPSIFNYNTTPAYIFFLISFSEAALSIISGTAVAAIYQSCKRPWNRDVLTATRFRLYVILLLMAWPAISLFLSILFLIMALLFAVLTPPAPWICLGTVMGLLVEWGWTVPCFIICTTPLKSKKQDPEAQMSTSMLVGDAQNVVTEEAVTSLSCPCSDTTINLCTQERAATLPNGTESEHINTAALGLVGTRDTRRVQTR